MNGEKVEKECEKQTKKLHSPAFSFSGCNLYMKTKRNRQRRMKEKEEKENAFSLNKLPALSIELIESQRSDDTKIPASKQISL